MSSECSSVKYEKEYNVIVFKIILMTIIFLSVSMILISLIENHTLKVRDEIKYNSLVKIAQIENYKHQSNDNIIMRFFDPISFRDNNINDKIISALNNKTSTSFDELYFDDFNDNFNDNEKIKEPLSKEQMNKLKLLTEEKVKNICPEIKNEISGKNDRQVHQYEHIVAEQLMPDNTEEVMKFIHNAIINCNFNRK